MENTTIAPVPWVLRALLAAGIAGLGLWVSIQARRRQEDPFRLHDTYYVIDSRFVQAGILAIFAIAAALACWATRPIPTPAR